MNSSNQITYSIIIPHYNIPSLLKRCLQSIPMRTDVQVIVVDDKSDEKYKTELSNISELYPWVSFIYSDINGGGGRARNIGLSEASGKYVLFADADDEFSLQLSEIFDYFVAADYDLIFFNVDTILQESLKKSGIPHMLSECIGLYKSNPEVALLRLRYMFGEPWCKIIRKDLITSHHIRFDEIAVHNDTTFSYLSGHYANSFFVDDRVGYKYYIREDSVSKNRSVERDYIKINVFGRSSRFFLNNNIPLIEERHWKALYHLAMTKDKKNYYEGIRMLQDVGYGTDDILNDYSDAVSSWGFFTPLKSACLIPDKKMKIKCINSWFKRHVQSLICKNHSENVFITTLLLAFLMSLNTVTYGQEWGGGKQVIKDTSYNEKFVADLYQKDFEESVFIFHSTRIDSLTGIESKVDNYESTDFISLNNITKLRYELPYSATSGITYYDSLKKVIPQEAVFSTHGGVFEGQVPNNAKYVRFSRRNDSERSKSIRLFETPINANVIEIPDYDGDSRIKVRRYRVFSNKEYYDENENGINYYSVTMPNHQVLYDGTIVAVAELSGSNRYLALKRSTDGGVTWDGDILFGKERLINGLIKDNASGGNPVLLYDKKGDALFLFYQPRSYRKSTDGGRTWSDKYSISHLFDDKYKGLRNYASPCNGIQLSNGVLAIAYRIEKIENAYDRVCVLFSRDGGNTWEISPSTPMTDTKGNVLFVDETALVEYKKNTVMLNSRGFTERNFGERVNRRVFVQNKAGAENPRRWIIKGWELEPESDLKLMDPVCQGSLIKADLYGKQFGVFANLYTDGVTRENLLIRVSSDFIHWSQCCFISLPGEVVHGYSSMCCMNNELSIMTDDDTGVFYLPFNYELTDKIMRTYAENLIAYKKNNND